MHKHSLGGHTDPLHEGMKIAAEQVQAARQLCQGVHMMAVRREDLIPQILEMAGVEPQVKVQPTLAMSAAS